MWERWLASINVDWISSLRGVLDVGAVLALTYVVLLVIGERRTLWMVRGFIVLMLASALTASGGPWQGLPLLHFMLDKLLIGAAVAMAVNLQSELRRFLELLGQGEIAKLFQPSRALSLTSTSVIDEIVEAVRELSQNRIGALIILETGYPIDERDFSVPGVRINADLSKELLQSIFQTTTLLHDGAVLLRDSRIVAAGVILPISERTASRQLGTRHRAAMGITERVENCVCIVVSEETGSISLAEMGSLNRPLTSAKLKELLEKRLARSPDRESVTTGLRGLRRELGTLGRELARLFKKIRMSASQEARNRK